MLVSFFLICSLLDAKSITLWHSSENCSKSGIASSKAFLRHLEIKFSKHFKLKKIFKNENQLKLLRKQITKQITCLENRKKFHNFVLTVERKDWVFISNKEHQPKFNTSWRSSFLPKFVLGARLLVLNLS